MVRPKDQEVTAIEKIVVIVPKRRRCTMLCGATRGDFIVVSVRKAG